MTEMTNTTKFVHPLAFPIKMVWTTIGMVAAFHIVFTTFEKHYHIMVDTQEERCIPEYSVYLVKKNIESIEKGKIYAFKARGMEPFYLEGVTIGKYASAIEGDKIVQNEQGVFINGLLTLTGYPSADKLGVKASKFYTKYTLDKEQIFFTGTAPRSYDSRYWGAAKADQVIGEAIPLW
ncbi:S26 family signal peptidase [Vibrio aestuarianus subsp. cardii]|uniref:S26 family signal peptidase n=1 Tax=Vibrio aestuarianus TaxID=28171 RepID=UPI00155868D9|nr:S26 family signal peptidase [Vibrio aestuarianus]NGZ66619.1 S26 family signal peptidase [Vibrio aestuarianus subsp. cardii]